MDKRTALSSKRHDNLPLPVTNPDVVTEGVLLDGNPERNVNTFELKGA